MSEEELRFQCLAMATKSNPGTDTDTVLKAAEQYYRFIRGKTTNA